MEKEKKQQEQEEPKVKTNEELEIYWDQIACDYTDTVSENVSSLYLSMLTMLEIEKSDSILEIAVGSGHLVPYLIQKKTPQAKLYLTDIATQFLAITKKRLELLEQNKQDQLYSFNIRELEPFQKPVNFESYNTTLEQANGENLENFKENSIQSYISSLCLQLTTDPQKMIKEAFRVLKPGGKACFSVWASKEKSKQLSIVPEILAKNNVKIPQERSFFHLNNRENLINMFKKENFSNILCWDQFVPYKEIKNEQEAENALNSYLTKRLISNAPEPLQQDIRKQIKEAYLNELNNNNLPLGLDTYVVLATKPQI